VDPFGLEVIRAFFRTFRPGKVRLGFYTGKAISGLRVLLALLVLLHTPLEGVIDWSSCSKKAAGFATHIGSPLEDSSLNLRLLLRGLIGK
jgi:hypothetical protein